MSALRLLTPAVLAALSVTAGCGYTTGSMMPEGVRSIAVQVFDNETRYRHDEITLSRELARVLARRAHVTLQDPARADAVLRGRIVELPRIPLVEDERDRILEGSVLVVVRFELVDPRTGSSLVAPFDLRGRAEHIEPRGETLQDAIDEAMRDLARRAVDHLQAHSFLGWRRRPAARLHPPGH